MNIQRSLVPRRPSTRFAGLEIGHLWEPLDEIGGDFLYYEKIGDRYLSLEIGDVMGHGTHAGLVMTALHGLFFGMRQELVPVDQMLQRANEFLCRLRPQADATDGVEDGSTFRLPLSSMFILRIDVEKGTLTYSNAGHPPPMYLAHNRQDHSIIPLETGGPILGALPAATYRASVLRPAVGDAVLLYTDGLSEASNEEGEEFTRSRLGVLLTQLHELQPREIISAILSSRDEFRGGAEIRDDVAFLVLQFGENWGFTGDHS